MKSNKPLVSIIIPTHNGETFIIEALESIIRQTFRNFEIIIVDDGSTDDTVGRINQFFLNQKDILFKLIPLNSPLGFSGDAAFNHGLTFANGKYIAKTDQDDIWHPYKLQIQVDFLEKHQDIYLCGTSFEHIDNYGVNFYPVNLPSYHEEIFKTMLFKANIHTPTIVFRNDSQPFFILKYPKYNDALTFYKLLGEGKKFANIDEILFKYRIHKNNFNHHNLKEYFHYYLSTKIVGILKYKYYPAIIYIFLSFLQYFLVLITPEALILKYHPAFKLSLQSSQDRFSNKLNWNVVISNLIRRLLNQPLIYNNFMMAILSTLRIKRSGEFVLEVKDGTKYILRSGPEDIGTLDEVYVNKFYDKIDYELRPDEIVVDIGAYIGDFTVYAAKRSKIVYAFEPIGELRQYARKNVLLNNLQNVFLFPFGLSNKTGVESFKVLKSKPLADSSSFNLSHRDDYDIEKSLLIKASSWAQLFSTFKPTYIKIDCEGAEFSILYDLPKEFFKTVRIMIIEYHNVHKESKNTSIELKKYLEKIGYSVQDKGGMIFSNIGIFYCKKIHLT